MTTASPTAALVPIPPRRAERVRILVLGSLAGFAIFVGGVIAHLPTGVAAGLLVVTVAAAGLAASARPLGHVVLVLCAPLVAAGLSYDDYRSVTGSFLLLTLGAAYAWLVSLVWPEEGHAARPTRPLPAPRAMLGYGARMGVAAAVAFLITSALGLDHPGWAPAACLLVARPQLDLLQTRGVGRVASVLAGALAAAVLLRAAPPDVVYAALALVVVASAAATLGSRWYITSALTSCSWCSWGTRARPCRRSTSACSRPSSASRSPTPSGGALPALVAAHPTADGAQVARPVPDADDRL